MQSIRKNGMGRSPMMQKIARAFLWFFMLVSISCGFEELEVRSSGSSASGSAPSAPAELSITAGDRQTTIQWKEVTGASSYHLYWSLTAGVTPAMGTKIADVSRPYSHTGLSNGVTYYYVITAVNAFGESGKSVEVAITLNDAPPAPTGVAATSGVGRVTVAWNTVEKALSYNLYWSSGPGVRIGGSAKIANAASPYTHLGLTSGSPYYYAVTAVNTSGESNLSQEVSAVPLTDPAGARTRVVWVQEMGEGKDPFATGSNLRLMGLDTGDGKGERVILGTVGNYAKPLITPRGDRVVYTDRIRKKVYLVNWDGTGLRELFGGFGLALWRDPRDGREWIYYGLEETKEEHCPAVYRTLLDSPGAGELIWNKTPVSVDSFQLSADGRVAGGNLPWPVGGVMQLPNREMKVYAKGCWTSLTTVNGKPFYWIFDGAHRNLTIVNLENEKKWQINISSAPGIQGHEVYHPRWSNHPRVMAMTGPYKIGSGGNRISAGGREVEIFIGRFNADLTAIESWWQATRNDRGDFFPDVWVAPVEPSKKTPEKRAGAERAKSTRSGPSTTGPGTAPRKSVKRLVVEARLTDLSVTPTPRDIAPYKRALLVNGYEVLRVVEGSYRPKKIMAAHWVIEEGRILTEARREKGKVYRMVLERFDDHPELEGERLIMDSDEFKLTLFYELRK